MIPWVLPASLCVLCLLGGFAALRYPSKPVPWLFAATSWVASIVFARRLVAELAPELSPVAEPLTAVLRPALRWVLIPALIVGLASLSRAIWRRGVRPWRALLPAAGSLALVSASVAWTISTTPELLPLAQWLCFPPLAVMLAWVLARRVVGSPVEATP